MALTLVLICQLLILTSCAGIKISSKLNFQDEAATVSDMLIYDFNKTGVVRNGVKVSGDEEKERSFEAKIPFLVSKKKGSYDIKIPLTVEEKSAEEPNKITFVSGLNLFERRTTVSLEKSTEKSIQKPVPVVKGYLFNVKPDFLIPIPYEYANLRPKHKGAAENMHANFWQERGSHEQKNEIEGLKPPAPDKHEWILNTTPFLGFPRNVTVSPSFPKPEKSDKVSPSLWNILDNYSWNRRNPSLWNQDQKSYWILGKPELSDLGHNYPSNHPYYTKNDRYPVTHVSGWNGYSQEPTGKRPGRGRWISCPPFEVTDDGPSARQIIPGCPQAVYAHPPDVEVINVTPISGIDDKTLFKELGRTSEVTPEEPKVKHS